MSNTEARSSLSDALILALAMYTVAFENSGQSQVCLAKFDIQANQVVVPAQIQ